MKNEFKIVNGVKMNLPKFEGCNDCVCANCKKACKQCKTCFNMDNWECSNNCLDCEYTSK